MNMGMLTGSLNVADVSQLNRAVKRLSLDCPSPLIHCRKLQRLSRATSRCTVSALSSATADQKVKHGVFEKLAFPLAQIGPL